MVERFIVMYFSSVDQNKVADLLLVQMEIYVEKEDNSAAAAISGFQTEMATKRQNLQTAALKVP